MQYDLKESVTFCLCIIGFGMLECYFGKKRESWIVCICASYLCIKFNRPIIIDWNNEAYYGYGSG